MIDLLTSALIGLSPATLVFCVSAMFVAAFIRGFTGFGSSLMWVPSLSLVLPPVAVLPITFLLEVAVSLHLMASVRREIDWRSLTCIYVGTAIGVPVGLSIITAVSADATRTAVALTVIVAAMLLWRGFRLKSTFSTAGTTMIGGAAGLLTGSVGIPGPPVFLYYLSAPLDITVGRASIIGFIFGAAVFGSAFAAVNGMMDVKAAARAALLLPIVFTGTYLGTHAFGRVDPEKARRFALIVLLIMGAVLLMRVIFAGDAGAE
jgi:uncharacterized membrane protein YfcA